ncbi:hypothetical protein POM88_036958 [Heracleum sosnowskyi]|uniref:Uncharacterized protein n=1 Tax=Heracleum sosnowskyi TaxID=360622 RepID=A0AAD8HPG9_9APIA|nr:hypothetical protein POM88_036958 [Heracleum sosnowskyi]
MLRLSTKTLRSCISNTAFSFSTEKQLPLRYNHDPSRSLSSSTFNNQQPFSPNHHLFKRSIGRPVLGSRHDIRRNLSSYNAEQGSSSPSGSFLSSWKRWIAGLAISAITLPLCKDKINSFLEWKNEVEIVVEDAEIIAEVVEKVAEEVVEIADLLTNKLPEGGKVKNAVDIVENVAKEIVKDANIAEDIINKVEDFEKEVESLIAPATGQANLKVPTEASNAKGVA